MQSHVRSWGQLGGVIETQPRDSLAACFGQCDAAERLARAGQVPPSLARLRADPELDPDPHGLELPADYLEMSFVVRVLALWGPAVLIEAAAACAVLQMQRQPACARDRAAARDAAHAAVSRYLEQPSDAGVEPARRAAAACAALYAPHEADPDSAAATQVWNELGAPWFAAETVAHDFSLQEWDGPPPREASITWGNRLSVWPQRAAEAAAHWSSPPEVVAAIRARMLAIASR